MRDIARSTTAEAHGMAERAVEAFRDWGHPDGHTFADFYEAEISRSRDDPAELRRAVLCSGVSASSMIARSVAGEPPASLFVPPVTSDGLAVAAVIEAHVLGSAAPAAQIEQALPLLSGGLTLIAIRQLPGAVPPPSLGL
jgi:hypothetical protein